MIDANMKIWLIEVNVNPDINTSSPVLTRIIPNMVEQALRITIDPLFPPPNNWPNAKRPLIVDNSLENNKWELIFDEIEDGPAARTLLQADSGKKRIIIRTKVN